MIIVDASVALKWVLPEDGSDAARNLWGQELAAPSIWLVEAGNALWRRAQTGTLSTSDAQSRLTQLLNAPVTAVPSEAYLNDALGLAVQLRHPVYDCLYLAAAIREGTHVVTADNRFLAAVARDRTLKKHVRALV